jgi:hypothetical protein
VAGQFGRRCQIVSVLEKVRDVGSATVVRTDQLDTGIFAPSLEYLVSDRCAEEERPIIPSTKTDPVGNGLIDPMADWDLSGLSPLTPSDDDCLVLTYIYS